MEKFWSLIIKFNLWRGDWEVGSVTAQLWGFLKISSVLKSFGNLRGNSYSDFFIVSIVFCFTCGKSSLNTKTFTAQKLKFSVNDFLNKYEKISRKMQIWSRLLKKSIIEIFIFCEWLQSCSLRFWSIQPWNTFKNWHLKKRNFKQTYLKEEVKFRVKTWIFKRFIQFHLKQRYFLCSMSTWVHGRRIHPLQPPATLLAAAFVTERVKWWARSFESCSF